MWAWVRSQREWESVIEKPHHTVVCVVYMLRWVADLDYGEPWAISDGLLLFKPSKSAGNYSCQCHIDLLLIYGNACI